MRQFTVEEATALLPRVRRLAEKMVELRARLRALQHEAEARRRAAGSNGGGRLPAGSEQQVGVGDTTLAELRKTLGAIEELGVLVKDVDVGLLDFPARHPVTGENVLLCWKVGETEIGYWHGEAEGFAGRKSLPLS
ncbi:MAG: DUF2203 domain-containing protein [Actinomycetia bacterium]|nr:DUF2203 domain-containing protein [Actinomycetes bacterium]